MFFLKKLLTQGIYPIPFLFILILVILWAVKVQKMKTAKVVSVAFISILLLFSFNPIPQFLAEKHEQRNPALLETPDAVPAVVVLGGGSCADKRLPITSRLSEASLIRLVEGITHLNRLDSAVLIVTGGAVFDTETIASQQRKMAIALGVDSSRILMADEALDTESEALAVREMVKGNSVILVTSALHMTRAKLLFEKVGFCPIPAPTNHLVKNGPKSPGDFFPDSRNLVTLRKTTHEYFGIIWSKLRGRI